MRIGIDVGGVLSSLQHEGDIFPGAIEVMGDLIEQGHSLFIVSQCGKARQEHTKEWLRGMGVPIPLSDQRYIGFNEKNKGRVIRELKLDVLIDDRPKHGVAAMNQSVQWLHMAGEPAEIPGRGRFYHHVTSWQEVGEILRRMQ